MSQAPRRRLYLHVGQHKTGTTWIQNVLDHNRARLAEAGVCYPELGACHGWPLVMLFARPDDIDRLGPSIGMRRRHSRPARKIENRRILDAALDDPKWRKIVISGEQLCDMLRWSEVGVLAEALKRPDLDVTVIFYAREPLGYAASMTQQRLKAGLTLKELAAAPPTPDYRRRLQKYFRFFGRENVEIRIYDRARLKNGDALADFMEAIGEPDIPLDAPASLADNSSMTGRTARLVDLRNRLFQRIGAKFARANPPWILPSIARLPGPRFALSAAVRADVARRSRDDLNWLGEKLGYAPFPEALPRKGRKAAAAEEEPSRDGRGEGRAGKGQAGKGQAGKGRKAGPKAGAKAEGKAGRGAQARRKAGAGARRRGGRQGGAGRAGKAQGTAT